MNEAVSRERTRNYLRQIKGAVVYRAVAMAASFMAIPMMINYLGQEQFGVWSTLLTVMSWMVFFDLGVGNGLRNKVAESLASGDTSEAGSYIASGYTLIGMIAMPLWVIVTVGSYFVPWQSVFNTDAISAQVLGETVRIVAFFILLNFWIGLIGPLLGAVQKPSLVSLGQLISNLLVLALVYLISRTTEALISTLAFVYGTSLVAANILLSLWFYKTQPELRPRIYIDKRHISPLLSVGLSFFIIQLTVLAIFTTDKILIAQLFGAEYVTQYEVVFKMLSIITFVHGIISAPLWSAYTDAYTRNDIDWIKNTISSQLKLFVVLVIVTLVLIVFSKYIIDAWIGANINISTGLTIATGVLVLLISWNNIFAMLVNGLGLLRPQLYTSVLVMIVYVPLAIYITENTNMGIMSIPVAAVIGLLPASIALPVQVYKLLQIQRNKLAK